MYRDFHQNPELYNQEEQTAAIIAKFLTSLGDFEIHEHIGGHGLAAVLKNGSGKTVLLRADMDALPVEEQTGLDYASIKKMKDQFGV